MKTLTTILICLILCLNNNGELFAQNSPGSIPNVFIINKCRLAECDVYWNSNYIHALKKRTCISFYDDPGIHTLNNKTYDGKESLTFDTKAGIMNNIQLKSGFGSKSLFHN